METSTMTVPYEEIIYIYNIFLGASSTVGGAV